MSDSKLFRDDVTGSGQRPVTAPGRELPRTEGPPGQDHMPIAVMFDHFGPYHWARLRGASKHGEVVGLELFGQTRDYSWERTAADRIADENGVSFRSLLPGVHRTAASPSAIHRAVTQALDEIVPDAVAIPGWSDQGGLSALDWCVRRGKPVVLMSESAAQDEPRRWAKEAVKQRIVRLCSAALVGGTPHREYMATLGMPTDRIFCGYDVVDNEYFARHADRAREQKATLRESLGLPSRYVLASKRFIPKKNLSGLLNAYALFRSTVGDSAWDLVILGDGPLDQDVRRLTVDLGVAAHVHFPGFKQYHETPTYYGLAEAFIHASTTEQWGLVVNEAMAAGLPVLVSARCGCAADLVEEGVNGFTFDPANTDEIANAMRRLYQRSDLSSMALASRRIMASWTIDTFGRNLMAAARVGTAAAKKELSLANSMMLRLLTAHPPQNADSMAYVRHRRSSFAR